VALFRGNTSTTSSSDVYKIQATISQYFVTNMSAGVVDVVIEVEDETPTVFTVLKVALAVDETKQYDIPIVMKVGDKVNITVSGSCDYYFNID
jgi:hypothetical protein